MAPPCPQPRFAALRKVRKPDTGEVIDEGLVLYFAAPRSETGEDLVEFQLHGGQAVIAAALAALGRLPGFRLAEPGEFARRAFTNGKIDITAAEGLADLVAAETEAQRRQALRQADGALARLYDGWRRRIIEAQALIEAGIDFSDEADVSRQIFEQAIVLVRGLEAEIRRHLDDGRRGEILRDGFHAVLAGPPNAGKSSLLNALVRRDAAIVSDEPGTTRDIVEVRLDLGGYPVIVADTAGLRDVGGAVEREGMRRTLARARTADLVIWLIDGAADAASPTSKPPPELDPGSGAAPHLVVLNKVDLLPGNARDSHPTADLAVSAVTGEGIDRLTTEIARRAMAATGGGAEGAALTQARHRIHLEACREALATFLQSGSTDTAELAAEDLRVAAHALGRITGAVDVEDVLGQIFGRFCIGK